MKLPRLKFIAATLLAGACIGAQASSHREALAVLNEPCADNTDTYAWVSETTHDKLYLIMNFNPLHEPGQGNQGLRACNGYRYEFHIGKGASLATRVVYRVEFKNTLTPEAAPSATDPLGGGNELLWQLTGGTETMKVTRIVRGESAPDNDDDDRQVTVLGSNLPVLPNNHGPQTDRLVYGLGRFAGLRIRRPDEPRSGPVRPDLRRHLHPAAVQRRTDHRRPVRRPVSARREGHLRPGQSGPDRPGRHSRRTPRVRPKTCSPASTSSRSRSKCRSRDIFPDGIPHNGMLKPDSTDSLLRVQVEDQPPSDADGRCEQHHHRSRGSGKYVQVGRNALPLFNAGLVGTQRQTLYLRSSPMHDVTNFGADILFPVLVRDAEALGIYAALGVPAATVATLKGPRAGHHQRHQPGPADSGRRRLHRRRDHARRRHRLELPERPAPGRRHGAEPQSGQRQQRVASA